MKTFIAIKLLPLITIAFILATQTASAEAPPMQVPLAPQISVAKALELADAYVAKTFPKDSSLYCQSVHLQEASVRPVRAYRHWDLVYRNAGAARTVDEKSGKETFGDFHVYVTMTGDISHELVSLIAVIPVLRDSGDGTLNWFLSKSDLVVIGKITSEPIGINDEAGVPNYICEFRVQDVLKGDGKLKDQVIKVNIIRFERDAKDKHLLISKDGECILFLKSAAPSTPSWVTADVWFGVQYPSPWMVRSLKRLATEK